MDSSNDLLWVQETKCSVVLAINEANLMWSFSFQSTLMSQITTKPPHKEKLHVLWFNRARTGTRIDDSCYHAIPRNLEQHFRWKRGYRRVEMKTRTRAEMGAPHRLN